MLIKSISEVQTSESINVGCQQVNFWNNQVQKNGPQTAQIQELINILRQNMLAFYIVDGVPV